MTTAAPYRSTVQAQARDGFGRLLRAEWTKLRSVPRWMLTLAASVLVTVLVALLIAAGARTSGSGGGERPPAAGITDQGHLTYRTMTGDGTLVARVASQDGGHAWAKAGLMIRGDVRRGAPYAAIAVTPGHGVRMQTGYRPGGAGAASGGAAPRWLRLTRAGTTVTGYESADGRAWRRVGAVRLAGLPATAAAGLFVAVPDTVRVRRSFGGETVSGEPADTRATFDGVALTPSSGAAAGPWHDRGGPGGTAGGRPDGSRRDGGAFTLAGSGDVGPDLFADDITQTTLTGVLIGQTAVVALAVLFVTAEYRRGTIRTTFAASPRRGRVLAAKAVVAGSAAFAAGLAAVSASLLLAAPVLRSHGMAPPPLTDGPVLRAAAGTAALLAVIAVFSLAMATIMRRSAPAITVVLLLLLVPQIVATGLPVPAARWVERLTPAAGFAIQRTLHRYDTAIGPWAGFGVLCAYTACALAAAAWLLKRRDA
ncbi:ABC transporter permease subunit [Actinomadura graeca]|uniref:ABC transporter permease subunit n=1 Tax=Actinomadura graeca TaxID=2750812 RepID=A0ABX8QM97_9ACTN|nr:ABC transporter permease subunit [Actinomadura graeca]QXJ19836.1 ABC transporter permease subunit [Actinomadura graeca]